jgi:hypothetical protein
MKNLKQKCDNFGKKYIGWDGCASLPVLMFIILILFLIMGWKGFAVFMIIFVLQGLYMKNKEKKNLEVQNE